MRYIFLILIPFLLLACKKSSHRYFAAGNERNMIITEINKTIDISENELISGQRIDINLDGSGIYDVSFHCKHQKSALDTSETTWHIYMKVLNDNFMMYNIGVDNYVSYQESLVDSNPESPVIETETIYSCEQEEGAELYKTELYLESFRKDEKINFRDYTWLPLKSLSIAKKNAELVTIQYEYDYYDTLIRKNTIYGSTCQNEIIRNENSYFVFREVYWNTGEKKLGWIEYKLTEEEFVIYRVAISDKPLR